MESRTEWGIDFGDEVDGPYPSREVAAAELARATSIDHGDPDNTKAVLVRRVVSTSTWRLDLYAHDELIRQVAEALKADGFKAAARYVRKAFA